jgi:hypothetical protein
MICLHPASANDSTAASSAGGLVLLKSEAISMDSEELYISPPKVHVKYRFMNETDRDITTTVAFPLRKTPEREDPFIDEG